MPKRRADGCDGFTLIEIMVVVFILGLLTAVAYPAIVDRFERAKVETAKTEIATLRQSIEQFRLENGRYPTQGEGLYALIPPPPANLPNYPPNGYVDETTTDPFDPWGFEYVYIARRGGFDVISYGRDGTPGGEGYDADLGVPKSRWRPGKRLTG